MRHLILHADDLGLSLGFNKGILASAERGWLTSTSLRVNGPAYQQAVAEILPCIPHVGVGLHLNIVEGRSLRNLGPGGSPLCDGEGRFLHSFGSLWRGRRRPELLADIESEFRNQIEFGLKDVGSFDHLNSHQHSHVIPELFDLVCRLADEYGIPYVRLPRERLHPSRAYLWNKWEAGLNFVKHFLFNRFAVQNLEAARHHGVQTNDWFIGVINNRYMDAAALRQGLAVLPGQGIVVEALFHPVRVLGAREECFLGRHDRDYVLDLAREVEVEALTDPGLFGPDVLGETNLTHYGLLASRPEAPESAAVTIHTHPLVKASDPPPPLKACLMLDEVTFHQPGYLRRLGLDCPDIEIVEVAIVVLPGGGLLQKYLLKHIRDLGLMQFVKLGIKKVLFSLAGYLPARLRGEFDASVEQAARRLGLEYRIISTLRDTAFIDHLRKLDPDIILSSNSLIFPTELLRLPRLGCINRHSGLLPSYGGILPVFRAVQFGEAYAGVAVHRMVEEIDGGEVLSRKWIPIYPGDTLARLYKLCFELSFKATREAVHMIRFGATRKDEEGQGIEKSYYTFPTSKDWREFKRRGGRFI